MIGDLDQVLESGPYALMRVPDLGQDFAALGLRLGMLRSVTRHLARARSACG
jgi:hypothetical protein